MDEPTLRRLDELAARSGDRAGRNRSMLVREAVREYVQRAERTTTEAKERVILRKHRDRLQREAAALVREQAQP